MWQHWQRIIKEEAEKYGYGQEVDIEEAKDPRFPKGFKKGESLWVPPGNDRGELISWKAGKEPGGTFTVKIFKTGKTVEVSARDIFKANSPKLLSTKEEVEEAYAPLDTKGIVGAFTESTKKKRFEYRNSTDSWGKSHGLMHEVCVSDPGGGLTQWRAANVKGTVCYIAVDEGADGKPVMEKWAIRNHVKYVKAESVEENSEELTEAVIGKYTFDPFKEGSVEGYMVIISGKTVGFIQKPAKPNTKTSVSPYTMFFYKGTNQVEKVLIAYPGSSTRILTDKEVRYAPKELLKAVSLWMYKIGDNMVSKMSESIDWKQIHETLAKAGGRRDVFLDAIEKAYRKGGLKGTIEGGKSFGFYDRTDVDTVLDNFDDLFDKKDHEYAAKEIKGFLKPQDYAKYKSKIEADIEDGEGEEPKEYGKIKIPGKSEFDKIAKGVAIKKLKRQATNQAVNRAGLKVVQTIGKQTLLRIALKVLGKEGARMLLSKIPIVGLALGTVFAVNRLAKGEYIKAAIELVGGVASTFPGYGTAAALAADAALVTGDIAKIKKMQDDLMKVRSGQMSEDEYKKKYRMDKLALEAKSDPRFEQFDNAVKMLNESDIDSSVEVDDEIIDMLFEEIDSDSWKNIHESKVEEAANLANEIRKVAKSNGVTITVESNTSVSFSKDFTKGNMEEFFAAYRDCDQVRRMVKFKSRGNEWGCGSSGFGIGAQECVKNGKVRLSKSGDGASYLLKALSKRF